MSQNGYINAVAVVRAGGNLREDASATDTTIYLDDAFDFNEDGGTVEINGVVYAYTAADLENDALTLATGLTADVEANFPASVVPAAMEKRASITMADSGDAIDVRVPHSLYDRIPEGIRNDSERESVTVEINGGEWAIVDVFGKEASIDGSYLNPTTVPPAATDGFPPDSSPLPIALGTVGVVLLKWSAIENHDPVTYQVHISTTESFTATESTFLGRTAGTFMICRTLPDNSVLDYGTTYYFRLIAEDADGAAEPSETASGSPQQVTGPDIAVNYVYAGNVFAEQIVGGTITSDLTLASTIKTADAGARVELSADGLLITDSTGTPTTILGTDAVNFFKGNIEAAGLTVLGGMTLRSTTNEVSRGAAVTLAQGVTSSTNPPNVVVDWEKVALLDVDGNPWANPGNLRGLFRTSAGKWMIADYSGAVHRFNADGTFIDTLTSGAAVNANSVVQTSAGTRYVMRTVGTQTFISRLDNEDVFVDAFSGTLAGWPSSYGTTAIDTGRAKVTLPNDATAGIKRTLEGAFKTRTVSAKVTPPSDRDSGTDIYMRVVKDANNRVYTNLRGTLLFFNCTLAGSFTSTYVTYDAVAHAYWRMWEFAGNFVWQTSPDNATWTTQRSQSHGLSTATLTGMTWEIGGLTPDAGVTNLLSNGTFETDTAGWIPANGTTTLSRSTTHKRTGTAALLLDGPTGSSAVGARFTGLSVTAGTQYTVQAYAYAPEASGNTAEFKAKWYDDNGAIQNDSVQITAINSSGFTLLSGTVTAPVGATVLKLELWNTDTSGNGSDSWWDDISVVEVGTSPTFTMFADDASYHAIVGSIVYTRINTAQAPAMGYDGTNLMVAEYDGSNNYVVRHISPDDMATIASTFTSATVTGFAGPLAGVLKGSFDFAEDRYLVGRDNAANAYWYPLKTSDGTYKGDDAFEVITTGHRGISWDGTNFWALGTDGNLYKHTNIKWTRSTDSASWNVGFTWYDGSSQESGVSPYTSLTMKMRARLTVTSPTIPYSGVGDPDRIRVYVGRGAGSKYLQTTTGSMVNTATLTTATFSGTVAPTVSTFSTATPAKIRNSDDSLVISADGSIKASSINLAGQAVYLPTIVRKSADQTVTNSAVSISDTHLRFTAVAGATYLVEAVLLCQVSGGSTASDFQVGWSVPSGSTSFTGRGPELAIVAGTTTSGVAQGEWAALIGSGTSTLKYGLNSTAGATTGIEVMGTFVCGVTGGTVAVLWSQAAAVAGVTTTVKAGSFLRATRIS